MIGPYAGKYQGTVEFYTEDTSFQTLWEKQHRHNILHYSKQHVFIEVTVMEPLYIFQPLEMWPPLYYKDIPNYFCNVNGTLSPK